MSIPGGGGAATRTLAAVFSVDTRAAEQGLERVAAKAEQVADRMEKAGAGADQIGDKVTQSSKRSETALGRMADSARKNGEAWQRVGGVLTTVGVAQLALGAAVAKTGISYNTLRQTSTAALTTMLGSAEAANRQMAKLDEWAANSPFARQVFIEAQRQLIGFGMAAEDVLPTLDAIQNAVAATGGSNQEIKDLTRIIAQVGAAGKITATDLMEFGQRGVDAATLIGSQMGKTGAQIREDITAGALGADEAIAALVAGMDERFEGAAANVKDTMAGAADRIKAAFRDLSASVMSSAVNPEGGGWLVDLTNKAADLLRLLESMPKPARDAAFVVMGLSGAALTAAGGFMVLGPRLVDAWDSLDRMGRFGATAQTGIRGMGRAARAAAGPAMLGALLLTLSKVGQSMLETSESSAVMENRLKRLSTGGGIDLSELLLGADGISDFNAELDRLGDPTIWQRIGRGVTDTGDGLLIWATRGHDGRTEATQFRKALGELDPVLAQVAATSREDGVEAFLALAESMGLSERGMSDLIDLLPGFRDYLVGVATEMGLADDKATLLAIATGELAPAIEGVGDAAAETDIDLEAHEEHLEALQEAYESLLSEIAGASGAFATLSGALSAHQETTREWAEEQAEAHRQWAADTENEVDSVKGSWEGYYDGFSVNLGEYLDELQSMLDAQANWQTNMSSLVGKVSDETLAELARLGPEGAPLVQALVDASAEELARFNELAPKAAADAGEAWAFGLLEQQALVGAAARVLGEDAAKQINDAIVAGEMSAAQAVLAYDLIAELELSDDPAAAALLAFVEEVQLTTARAKVDADLSAAIGGLDRSPQFYDQLAIPVLPGGTP